MGIKEQIIDLARNKGGRFTSKDVTTFLKCTTNDAYTAIYALENDRAVYRAGKLPRPNTSGRGGSGLIVWGLKEKTSPVQLAPTAKPAEALTTSQLRSLLLTALDAVEEALEGLKQVEQRQAKINRISELLKEVA